MSNYTKVIQAMVNRGYVNPDEYDVIILPDSQALITHNESKLTLNVNIREGIIVFGTRINIWAWQNDFPTYRGDEYIEIWNKYKHIWAT